MSDDWRPLHGPLAPGDAAYLQHELEQRGIHAELEEKDGMVLIEVKEADHAAAVRLARSLLDEGPAEPETPETRRARRRKKALFVSALGAVFVLYVGRTMPKAARGGLAVVIGLLLYFAFTSLPDGEGESKSKNADATETTAPGDDEKGAT